MTRILIVEDEPGIADSLIYSLQAEAFETDWCRLGRQVPARLTEFQPDLLLLDIGLPDMSGLELFRQVRAQSGLPVIFLTARGDEIDRVLGLELGADDYVIKPFSPRELIARIRAVLRRTSVSPAEIQTGFELDSDKARIRYGGHLLNLTRSEYLLLVRLHSQPERVFSREQLLASLDNQVSGDRCIDTHIKSLRAKLRHCQPEQDPIKTHRGLGYSLELPQ